MIHDKIETVVAYPVVSKTEEGLMTKKWLAILLTAVLTVSMFPAAVWGDELPDVEPVYEDVFPEEEPVNEADNEELPVDLEFIEEEDTACLNSAADLSAGQITGLKTFYRVEIVNGTGYQSDVNLATIDGVKLTSYKPSYNVVLNGKTLKKGTDYTESVSGEIYGGVSVSVQGIGDYSGEIYASRPSAPVFSFAGKNRWETNVKILNAANYTISWSRIVVVWGRDYPDALAANAYAGLRHSPLIMVERDKVPSAIKSCLTRKKDSIEEVVVIGGKMDGAAKELKSLLPGASFRTIAGSNRYQTADKVTRQFLYEKYSIPLTDNTTQVDGSVFVTTGQSPADALSASSWSYTQGIPVLLVKDGTFNKKSDTANIIKHFKTVYLLGDTKVVKDSVVPGGARKIRLGGKNRWETSRKIADHFVGQLDNHGGVTLYVPGEDKLFSDALAAGQLNVLGPSQVILVREKNAAVYLDPTRKTITSYIAGFFIGSAGKDHGPEGRVGTIYNAVIKNVDKQCEKQVGS